MFEKQTRFETRDAFSNRHTTAAMASTLQMLAWDSQHFGFPVGRIEHPTALTAELELLLRRARAERYRLIYWPAAENHPVSQFLLSEYCGARVDRRTVYAADLESLASIRADDLALNIEIGEYTARTASSELLGLGIAAGSHSRFFRDSRIPRGAAERLYAIWTEKSVQRELADIVLVARHRGLHERLVGMVSCACRAQTGSIVLIAVAPSCRGKGIATALLAASHRWMIESGALRAEVVTQKENTGACRLYERCGYKVRLIQDYYHFWPTESTSR